MGEADGIFQKFWRFDSPCTRILCRKFHPCLLLSFPNFIDSIFEFMRFHNLGFLWCPNTSRMSWRPSGSSVEFTRNTAVRKHFPPSILHPRIPVFPTIALERSVAPLNGPYRPLGLNRGLADTRPVSFRVGPHLFRNIRDPLNKSDDVRWARISIDPVVQYCPPYVVGWLRPTKARWDEVRGHVNNIQDRFAPQEHIIHSRTVVKTNCRFGHV